MEFPDLPLPLAGGGVLERDDLLGRSWVVYLTRHPGWPVCQLHLRRAVEARSAIRAQGADLLVVMPIDAVRVDEWRRRHGARDVLVAGDPERALYRALGVGRGSARALLLDPASWRDGLREAARLRPAWKARGDDGFQLGADLLLGRDGEVRFIHRARSAADRVPVDELLARL